MNILDEIIAQKRRQVAERKHRVSISELENSIFFGHQTRSLKAALTDPAKSGIIAEHKRKSPSKGIINQQVTVEDVTTGYVRGGASALSILTEEQYFDGSDEHLLVARRLNPDTPILRKDFTVDEYQIVEAKSLGADAILLIAANLTPDECRELAWAAKNLTLEVLLEVHDRHELDAYLNEYVDVVGVNNRNLKTMQTDTNTSKELAALIPHGTLKISESGISQPAVLLDLKHNHGYHGFLIGEHFMQQPDPAAAFAAFAQAVREETQRLGFVG